MTNAIRVVTRAMGILLGLSVAACTTSPLAKYIERYDYVAFNPSRTADGVGTIIDFESGAESIVARATDCVLSSSASQRRGAPIPTLNYTVTTSSALELDLPRAVLGDADISAALGMGQIKTVRIELVKPFEDTISRLDVTNYLDGLEQSSACRKLFENKDNVLINQVLGVNGLKYEFLNETNQAVRLTAEILAGIGLSPEFQRKYSGKESLDVDTPILIGYRGWKITQAAGAVGAPLALDPLSAEAIETRRNATK